jgi:hypothetical protein
MLIVFATGFSPAKDTFPVIVASEAGSTAAGAGASAFFSSGFAPPPQEVKSSNPVPRARKVFDTNAIGYIIVFNPS